MGNQLSGVAPSHPLSAENYLADLNRENNKGLEFRKNLGSTRFLKVVMCKSDNGPVVIKIFVIQDPTLPLLEEKKKIDDIASKLLPSSNCLPYKRVELTERVVFIIRPYLKSSLYDRISTRPFLAPIEKKWLAFQLLSALKQSHMQKIYHGDIKLENILVTSWLWLILTDFASYKPVLLPEDNPTHFTYFFDTSRRRVCHIAPERFIKTIQNGEFVLKPPQEAEAFLTPEMDMFSVGCVLAELFTEGLFPFSLMQLLQYRSNNYYPTEVLDKITDSRARSMVEQMIKMNPSERRSAEEYLKQERGNLFPEYFYNYFLSFFKQFSLSPALIADERIKIIKESLPDILEALELKKMYDSLRNIEEEKHEERDDKSSHNESIVLVISLITSCVRALQFPSSKITTLELFKVLSEYTPNDIILDRILPYIFNLLKDPEARVRAESIYTLAHCLKLVNAVPRSEANIFLEYILPALNEVSSDPSVIVREADAANISTIADAALKFLIYCSEHCPDYSPDTQIDSLHEIIQQKLAKMFSDSSNIVKRALIESNLDLLCKFFGKEKANDILFSHLITFLNEKKDFHLRLSFYNNITDVATFMGSDSHQILKPLFLQGLSDTEEGVIVAAIDNMTKLTEKGIFPNHILCEIVQDASPLLIHPNQWIRLAMVGLIVAVSYRVEYLDVITTLTLTVLPFLKEKGFQRDEGIMLARLKDPLPRGVYDSLVKCKHIEDILNILEDIPKRQMSVHDLKILLEEEAHAREASSPMEHVKKKDDKIETDIKHVLAAGLTYEMVPLILHMKDHLTKVNRHKETLINPQPKRPELILNGKSEQHLCHQYALLTKENSVDLTSNLSSSHSLQKSSSLTMNEEWQTMFGNGGGPEENRNNSGTLTLSKQSFLGASLSSQCFMLDPSTKDSSKTQCHQELEQLIQRKREELLTSMQAKSAVNAEAAAALKGRVSEIPSLVSEKWRPKGHLVAHLQEHSAAVTKLIPLKGTPLFASSSKDGTFKLWDSNKTERTYPINRAKFTYNQNQGSILSLAYCSMQECIASASASSSASNKSSIHVVKIDKQSLISSRQIDTGKDGYAVDMVYMDAGSQSLLTYSTVFGKIYGWDLRSPGDAWVLDNDVQNGLITSYAIDKNNNWLSCGTSSGFIMCWDLRFMLPVAQLQNHHSENRNQHSGLQIGCLKMHPTEPSWVISTTRAFNEVAFFNMETQSRTKTLWASPEAPFSHRKVQSKNEKQRLANWFNGLWAEKTDTGKVYVLTGGTDGRLRYWDLDSPELSYVISHRWCSSSPYKVSYSSQVVDNSEVIIEKMLPPSNESKTEDSQMRSPDQPCTGHLETITDVIVVNQPQKMVVSCGYDGTIKMWK